MAVPNITLNNGKLMPQLGLGTWNVSIKVNFFRVVERLFRFEHWQMFIGSKYRIYRRLKKQKRERAKNVIENEIQLKLN